MSKLKTLSILDAAKLLNWQPTGKLSTQQQLTLAQQYLDQYELTEVPLDAAFVNSDGTVNQHCFKQSEVNKLIKQLEEDGQQ